MLKETSHKSVAPLERPPEDAEALARGAGVNLLTLLAKLTRPLFYFVAARLYGAEAYGLYFLAWTYIELLSRLTALGLNQGMLRYIAYYNSLGETHRVPACFRTAFYISGALGLGLSTAFFLFARPLALLLHHSDLVLPLKWLAFTLFLQASSGLFIQVTLAQKVMKYQLYFKGILEPLLLTGLAVLFFHLGAGLKGLCIAHLLTMGVVFLCSGASVLKFIPLRRWIAWTEGFHREMITFSLSVFMADAVASINARLDVMLLGEFASARMIGIYGLATQVVDLVQRIRFVFEPIANPIFTELYAKKEIHRLGATLKLVARWILLVSVPLALILVLFGGDLADLMGPGYRLGYPWMLVLLLGAGVSAMLGPSAYILALIGRPDLLLFSNLTVLVVSSLAAYVLIATLGPLGAAMAMALTLILTQALALWWVFRKLGIHPFYIPQWKPLVAGLLTAALLKVFTFFPDTAPAWNALWHLPLLFLAYGGLLLGFGLEAEERAFGLRIARSAKRISTFAVAKKG